MTMTDDIPELDDDDGWVAKLTGSLNLFLGAVNKLAESQDRANRLAQAALLVPAGRVEVDSGIAVTATNLILEIGGPAQGRLWDVSRIVIGGNLPTTAAAGAAYVYVSSAPSGSVPTSITEWVDTAATLPLNAFYSPSQVFLRYPERLYVVVVGGTNAQQYTAGARIVDRVETPTVRSSDEVGA